MSLWEVGWVGLALVAVREAVECLRLRRRQRALEEFFARLEQLEAAND